MTRAVLYFIEAMCFYLAIAAIAALSALAAIAAPTDAPIADPCDAVTVADAPGSLIELVKGECYVWRTTHGPARGIYLGAEVNVYVPSLKQTWTFGVEQ